MSDDWRQIFNVDKLRENWEYTPPPPEQQQLPQVPPVFALETFVEFCKTLESEIPSAKDAFADLLERANALIQQQQPNEEEELLPEKELEANQAELQLVLNDIEDLMEAFLIEPVPPKM